MKTARSWWCYTRFSSEMQSASSCTDQERECLRRAEKLNLGHVETQRDEAVRAGAQAGKDGWRRIVAAADQGLVEGIIFEDLSRFSRDFFSGMSDIAQLKKLRVKFADSKMGIIDLDSPMGQMYVSFGLIRSQQETQQLGERSKRGLRGLVLGGFSSGGRPAYGLHRDAIFSDTVLDVDGRRKRIGVRLVPSPTESPIVVRIFERYDAGLSKHEIARTLNDEGVPTRDAGSSRHAYDGSSFQNSGKWSAGTIKGILENEIYCGLRIWNRHSRKGDKLQGGKKRLEENDEKEWERVVGYCPPIVDDSVWQRVQLRLKADAAKYKKHHIANEHGQFLLSGLIRCASCGWSFVIGTRRKGVRNYRCGFNSRGACKNTINVPQPALEQRVRRVLDVVVKDPRKLEELVAEHNRRVSNANEAQLGIVRSLQARHQKLAEERDRFVEAIGFGSGSTKILVAEVEKRVQEIEALAARIVEAETLVAPLLFPRLAAAQDYIAGSASLFAGDLARDKQFLTRVLEGISVHADATITLRFREASLFGPVTSFGLGPAASSGPRLEDARKLHRGLLENGLAQFEDCQQKPKAFRVEEANGLPFYRFDPPNKTLASPAGFSRDIAAEHKRPPIALVLCNVADLEAA